MVEPRLRLRVLAAVLALAGAACCYCSYYHKRKNSAGKRHVSSSFQFEEATVESIQRGFKDGSLTSTALVQFYLDQIDRLNPLLRAVIEVNPDALEQAARADAERSSSSAGSGARGPLHGVPVLLKDNIATRDWLARAGRVRGPARRRRGDPAPASRGRDPRQGQPLRVVQFPARPMRVERPRRPNTGKFSFNPNSSSFYLRHSLGAVLSALRPVKILLSTAMRNCGIRMFSRTHRAGRVQGHASLRQRTWRRWRWAQRPTACPSSLNSVVGIKPTVGLTSRSGVIPISPSQDSVGPICRTVSDAVHVLDAIVGYDELDAEATGAASKYIPLDGYRQFLRVDGLKGKRIGFFFPPGLFEAYDDEYLTAYENHMHTLRQHGAIVIEDLETATDFDDLDIHEKIVMSAEFKSSLNAYLSDLVHSPVRSLAIVLAFNNAHSMEERLDDFGQPDLITAEKTNGIGMTEKAAIQRLHDISTNGLEKVMKGHQLDAIVAPNSDASSILAIGGYPAIAVPAGYNKQGVPFGLCFGGLKGYEPRLIEIAYAFE